MNVRSHADIYLRNPAKNVPLIRPDHLISIVQSYAKRIGRRIGRGSR